MSFLRPNQPGWGPARVIIYLGPLAYWALAPATIILFHETCLKQIQYCADHIESKQK